MAEELGVVTVALAPSGAGWGTVWDGRIPYAAMAAHKAAVTRCGQWTSSSGRIGRARLPTALRRIASHRSSAAPNLQFA